MVTCFLLRMLAVKVSVECLNVGALVPVAVAQKLEKVVLAS